MKFPSFPFSKLSSLQFLQLFRFGALFLTSIVLAKIIADRDVIGQYESLVLIGSSFSFFWVSGIINTFIPFYHAQEEADRPRLIFNTFSILSLISLLVFGLLVFLYPALFSAGRTIYFYYLVFTLFSAPSFLTEYIFLVKDRSQAIFRYGIFSSILQFGALSVPLWLGYPLETALLWLAIFAVGKYIFSLIQVIKWGQLKFDLSQWKRFSSKAFPIILGMLLGGSMPYVDSYFVKYFYKDNTIFAIFQYGSRELPLVLLMANALSNVLSGEIAENIKIKQDGAGLLRLRKSSLRLMHLLFPLTMVLLLSSSFLFRWFYSEAFLASAGIFNIYLLLVVSRLVFPQTVLLGLQKNRQLLYYSMAEWTLNFILNLVLIQYMGLLGVALATVIAYYFDKLVLALYLNHLGVRFSQYVPVRQWLVYSFLTFACFAIGMYHMA